MAKKIHINGKPHSLVVLRITDWDEAGRPSKCVIGYDDTTFNVADPAQSNHFMTCFVPTLMTARNRRDN